MKDLLGELNRYNVFCKESLNSYLECINGSYELDGYFEKHHILPKCLFPEYANESWNIKKLPYSVHAKAHVLLHRMYRHPGLTLAAKFMYKAVEDPEYYDEYIKFKWMFCGDNNPAKRQSVRDKITCR